MGQGQRVERGGSSPDVPGPQFKSRANFRELPRQSPQRTDSVTAESDASAIPGALRHPGCLPYSAKGDVVGHRVSLNVAYAVHDVGVHCWPCAVPRRSTCSCLSAFVVEFGPTNQAAQGLLCVLEGGRVERWVSTELSAAVVVRIDQTLRVGVRGESGYPHLGPPQIP